MGRWLGGWLCLAVVAGGCAPSVGPADVGVAGPADIAWPSPPAQPRIRLVQTVARPEDLGVEPSLWQRIGRVIVGRQEDWLVRPTTVVARGDFLFVADPGAQTLWSIDRGRGKFLRVDRAGAQRLISPVAVAVDDRTRVYVADSFLGRIFVLGADFRLVSTIVEGVERPAGLAFDPGSSRLYVADSKAHRVVVYAADGTMQRVIGGRGVEDGKFNFPTYLTVDRDGSLYVVDSLGFRVQVFDREGRFLRSFGRHGDSSGSLASPKGVALDSEGHVYVVDALFDTVQVFDMQGRLLLAFGERGVNPGQFWLPAGLFIDASDRIYVADAYNQRLQIFQYVRGEAR